MVLKTAVESMNTESTPQNGRTASSTGTNQYPSPNTQHPSPAYFAEILRSEFPQYSVRQQVPVTELAGFAADEFKLYKTRPLQSYKAEWGQPYDFVLSQGDKPVGVVMLGSGGSHSKNVKYLIARMYAKKLGLPYINFYTQYPNERSYVVERIRKFMNA